MGTKLAARRGISVTAGQNILGSNLVIPGVNDKLTFTVVPQASGVLSAVRLDGTGASQVVRVATLLAGASLPVLTWTPGEFSAPKFYSFVQNEVRYNFRYSVSTTFDIFVVYSEREHAASFLAGVI